MESTRPIGKKWLAPQYYRWTHLFSKSDGAKWLDNHRITIVSLITLAGLTSHPSRPFVMATCSRDSTVRIWSLTPLIQPVEINILAQRPWNEIIQAPGNVMSPHNRNWNVYTDVCSDVCQRLICLIPPR